MIPIELPPLRDRPEDIALLATYFIDSLCDEMSIPRRPLSADAIRALEAYRWPGNARELRNVLERLLVLHDDDSITAEHLAPQIQGVEVGRQRGFVLPPEGVDLDHVEKQLILQALERSSGNKSKAARLLGVSRDTLRYRLEKYGLEVGS